MNYFNSPAKDKSNHRLFKYSRRIRSIDMLRGLVMILMALDHTREFFSSANFNPADLALTTPGLFFTRWITHICAPVFVFLAGTSAYLYGMRAGSKKGLSNYLLTRGLLLIVLEFTIVKWGWQFSLHYSVLWVQVIWVLGVSMIVLAWLINLPVKRIMIFGIAMILLHNLVDGINAEDFGSLKWLWLLIHQKGTVSVAGKGLFQVVYPLVPWVGVMAVGYGFGETFLKEAHERKKYLLQIGLAISILFLVVRGINIYGDPHPWSQQKNLTFTIMSFLNCEKYPPSLSFMLMTLGPAITLLGVFEGVRGWKKKFLLPFGRTPLFFYLIHIPLIHLLSVLFTSKPALDSTFIYRGYEHTALPTGYGFDLPVIYLIWIIVVLGLYPLSKWYAELKSQRKYKWLSYL